MFARRTTEIVKIQKSKFSYDNALISKNLSAPPPTRQPVKVIVNLEGQKIEPQPKISIELDLSGLEGARWQE